MIAPGVAAQTDFGNLSAEERAILHREIREVLTGLPALLPRKTAPPAPPSPLQREIATDRARIAALADDLFDPARPGFGPPDAARVIAVFTGPDCGAPCAQTLGDLRAIAATRSLRVTVIDTADAPGMVRTLGIDTTPFIVFPDMFLVTARLSPRLITRPLPEA